jgi:hypothetical protein
MDDVACPKGGQGWRCAAIHKSINAHLCSVPMATTLVGVIPLLGGDTDVFRHDPRSNLGLVVVFGRKVGSEPDQRPMLFLR